MYEPEIKPRLAHLLNKLKKKDRIRFLATQKKMEEICIEPHHYKNLKYDLKEYKRVHIDSSFVLIFRVSEENSVICFENLEHHDKVYER